MGDSGWLQQYTFPAEKRFADTALARRVCSKLVSKLLRNGTTTAVYFGSIHLDAAKALVDTCRAQGQRALVGKVAMDQHGAEGYVETTQENLRDTEALIQYCYSCQPDASTEVERLVNPAVTPRFIPTCSEELLIGLGALAAKYRERGCWVQSHIAESHDEIAFVEALFPGERDAEIFDRAGLLTDRCVMAHGVHLNDEELRTLSERGAGVACCPLSNVFFAGGGEANTTVDLICLPPTLRSPVTIRSSNEFFAGGDFPLRRAQRMHSRVGLGTDVAGGYSPSMMSSCRTAVLASKVPRST